MRLAIVVPWTDRLGGAENMLWTFLRRLDTDAVQATVVFLEPGPFEREVAALPGVRTAVVPIGRLRAAGTAWRAVRRLAALLRELEPDVVLNWVAKAQMYGGTAAAMAGLRHRVVWWQHGIPSGHWMDRIATAVPASAVGCSSSAAGEAQRRVRPHRPTFVVHPGIEHEPVAAVARADLGIPEGRTVVGIVGRLQPWKGQHRLLEAVAGLVTEGHDLQALVVGGDAHGLSPEYTRSLDELVVRLDLTDRVTMTGHVPDPRAYVQAMDILVNASDHEPFGIVLIEGMAESVPVVAVGDAGPRDILEDGRSGVLVASHRSEDLAAGIRRLVTDPVQARAIGAAGHERFLQLFTAQAMADSILEVLEAVREQRPIAPRTQVPV